MTNKFEGYEVPIKEITPYALQANAEGSVLLENDGMLPLRAGDRVAVFGRMQSEYNHSGTGSGGLVRIKYKTNIYDCLAENNDVELNRELREVYLDWIKENPYDKGPVWPGPPWSQVEMPLTEEVVRAAAAKSDKAIVVIARNAGEARDNYAGAGSYLLTEVEYQNLCLIRKHFKRVCAVLNVGNIIDMKWAKELEINAVLYVWQGGQDGGRAVADILCGRLVPSGKLSDTVAYDISDYPSTEGFCEDMEIVYGEDVYVGYRYFETFARDKVMYPFGYGKSYTDFSLSLFRCSSQDTTVNVELRVRNIGAFPGKETVQVYYGKDGSNRPSRALVAFKKTEPLLSGEEQSVKLSFDATQMAYFDEARSAFVLEEGAYQIYVGTDVRSARLVFEYVNKQERVVCECKNTLNPNREFSRMKNENGALVWETVTPRENEVGAKPEELSPTGDRGIRLADVYNGTATMEDFVAQLSDFELACLSQGEGMNSIKVRPGTGGAFGGLTKELRDFGIPAVSVSDGPSGLRLENGDNATSFPGGTMLACTFNPKLVQTLYRYASIELYKHRVDALLGPGINVHRNPLCGRNFEYLSEDPYLTGVIAGAMCRGLDQEGITGTVKHFAGNNREENRIAVNSLVSQRALREIYLKPFEMIIRDGHTRMVMTAYNRLNGDFCSANYHLVTTVLREDWGFDGLVMTDWWPNTALPTTTEKSDEREGQIASQNDLFMVNKDVREPAEKIVRAINEGRLLRAELQRNAINVLKALIKTPNYLHYLAGDVIAEEIDLSDMKPVYASGPLQNGDTVVFSSRAARMYGVRITYTSPVDSLVQMGVDLAINSQKAASFGLSGTSNEERTDTVATYLSAGEKSLTVSFDPSLVEIKKLEILE